MKVSELNEDQLDHFVALALGGKLDGDGWRFDQPIFDGLTFIKTKRSFCREWTYGGPIIELERITVKHSPDGWEALWYYQEEMGVGTIARGSTPLIAAMRAFVCDKLGQEVPDIDVYRNTDLTPDEPSEEGPD